MCIRDSQGGYGIAAKMPSLLYLYPENAYFEYININELANENIPESQRLFMTTTEVQTFSKDDSLGEETQFAPENHNKYFKPEHEARSHDSIRDYGN